MTFWALLLASTQAAALSLGEEPQAVQAKELIVHAEMINHKIQTNELVGVCAELKVFDENRVAFLESVIVDVKQKKINLENCDNKIQSKYYQKRAFVYLNDLVHYLKSTWQSFNQNFIGDLHKKTLREKLDQENPSHWPTWK